MVFSSHPDMWVRLNIVDTLRDMGVDLVFHDWGERFDFYAADWNTVQRRKMNEELLKTVEQAHRESPVDLLITYYWRRHIDGKVIDKIRDMGICCVNFGCNDLHQFHLVKELIGHYDYHWVSERDAVRMFSDAGGAPVRVQLAANPKWYFPVVAPLKYDLSFTGSCYGERIDYFSKLAKAGLEFHVFGSRWSAKRSFPRIVGEQLIPWRILFKYETKGVKEGFSELKRQAWEVSCLVRRLGGLGAARFPGNTGSHQSLLHGPLKFDEMVRLFSESRISMNFSACGARWDMPKGRLVQIKLRDFEGPMSGALFFTEYQDELKEFYEIGKEIVCYHDPDDLVEKAKFYLREPEEGLRIRKAARERCLRDHTWEKRFEELFSKLKMRSWRPKGSSKA